MYVTYLCLYQIKSRTFIHPFKHFETQTCCRYRHSWWLTLSIYLSALTENLAKVRLALSLNVKATLGRSMIAKRERKKEKEKEPGDEERQTDVENWLKERSVPGQLAGLSGCLLIRELFYLWPSLPLSLHDPVHSRVPTTLYSLSLSRPDETCREPQTPLRSIDITAPASCVPS